MAEPPASAETEKSSVRAPVSSLLSTRNGRNGGDGSGGRRSRRPFLRRTSVVLTESARRRSQGSGRGRNIHGVRSTEQGSNCCCSRDRLSGSFNRQGRRNAQGRHYWVLTLAASCILFAIPHLFDVACSSPPRARQPPEFTPEHTNGSLVRRNRKDTPEKGERLSWEQSPAGDGKTANGFDLRDGGGYEPPGNQVESDYLDPTPTRTWVEHTVTSEVHSVNNPATMSDVDADARSWGQSRSQATAVVPGGNYGFDGWTEYLVHLTRHG